MASKSQGGKAYTAPKGRPTEKRNAAPADRRMSPTVQWILALIAFLVVLGAIFYFARDFRTAGVTAPDAPTMATALAQQATSAWT